MTVRVALVGCGAWGKNLLRVLVESPLARVVAVADPSADQREFAANVARSAAIVASMEEALAAGVDAVVIATPPATHAALALAAIDAGADVFVEKPLALTTVDADRCVAAAAARRRVGMVGHLLRYHPAVVRMLALAEDGALGALRRVEAARFSVARDRSASSLWTLGPHDISVLHALDPSPIRSLAASAGSGGDPVLLDGELESGLRARIALAGSHTSKERRICVAGTVKVAVLDDVRAPDRVILEPARKRAGGGSEEIQVAWAEPLAIEIDHFLRCVRDRSRPLTPFEDGARVVRMLARAEANLRFTTEARRHGDFL